MDLQIQLTRAAIPGVIALPPAMAGLAGAWVEYRGKVRAEENGQPICALEYEAYEPMALSMMRQIAEGLEPMHPCLAMRVIHRIGIVPAGESAIYIGICAKHREAAFAMLSNFVNRLKQDVPVWKIRALPVNATRLGASIA